MRFQTKPALALALIGEVLAAGVSRAPVLGEEVYGVASELRRGLRELDLEYFLNAGGDLLAWIRPVKTRRAKKYWDVADGQPPALCLAALSRTLKGKQWHAVACRRWHQTPNPDGLVAGAGLQRLGSGER